MILHITININTGEVQDEANLIGTLTAAVADAVSRTPGVVSTQTTQVTPEDE